MASNLGFLFLLITPEKEGCGEALYRIPLVKWHIVSAQYEKFSNNMEVHSFTDCSFVSPAAGHMTQFASGRSTASVAACRCIPP